MADQPITWERMRVSEFERLERESCWRIGEHARWVESVWTVEASAEVSYPDEARAALAEIEARSFWFRHRNKVIQRLLDWHGRPAALWEIGSGNGFVAWSLQQQGLEVVAVEPGAEGARLAAKRGVKHSVAALLEQLRLPVSSLPALGFFDVLEHLHETAPFLRECHRVLKPGGLVVVTVPAHPFLWSQADLDAGHYRRYTRRTLDDVMRAAGFKPLRSAYMMMSLWVPLFLLRALPYRMGRRKPKEENLKAALMHLAPTQGLATAFLSAVLAVEFFISRWLPLTWGTSVVAVYLKP